MRSPIASESPAARIGAGSHVTLHYRLTAVVDGAERELVNTFGAQPATLLMGSGQLAPGLEQRLLGLAEGQRAEFELAAGEGFGSRSAELVQTLSRAAFDANAEPAEPGAEYAAGDVVQFRVGGAGGGACFTGVLKQRDAERVVVDFNHPLAGLPLKMSVQVVGVL